MPELRKFARSFEKTPECEAFLKELPHKYYDENMLHSVLLCSRKPFERCLESVMDFLPYIDNWATCDTIRPKVFKKNREELLPYVKEWIKSDETYTCRFGLDTLMSEYLEEDFKPEYLELPAAVSSEEYYVNMMIAWYYATALAKQWESTVPYLEENRLGKWVHNKTIQKAIESFRIMPEQKDYLRGLKQKNER